MSEQYSANIVKTVLPKGITPIQPASASKFILSRRFKRFLPDQQTVYTESGVKSIRFTINDSTGFWKPDSHYMKFKVLIEGTDADKYIDTPGAAAFFQRVAMRTASGSRIEERDYYGLFESVKSHVMDSPECVEYLRHQEGDSMGSKTQAKPYFSYGSGITDVQLPEAVNATGLGAFQITAAGPVTVTEGEIVYVAGREFKVTVSSTTAAFAVTPSPEEVFLTADDANGLPIYTNSGSSVEPRRKQIANAGIAIEFIHKIDLGILKGERYLPLPMVKNLQIELDLAKPEFCLVSPGNAANLSYTISNPELIAEVVEFDRSIIDQYKELYNSGGIAYPFETYRYNNRSFTATNAEVQVYANVRAAHSLVNVLTDANTVTTTNAKPAESLSTFKKFFMKEYEVLSGSERKPFYGPVRLDDIYAVDAYKQLRKTFMVDSDMKNMSMCGRIHPSELVNSLSNKFIFGAVLGREDGDAYAALDLTNENLQVKVTFDASQAGVQKYLHSFLMHSSTLNISSDGVILRS